MLKSKQITSNDLELTDVVMNRETIGDWLVGNNAHTHTLESRV